MSAAGNATEITRSSDVWTLRVGRLDVGSQEKLLHSVIEAQQTGVPTLIFRFSPGGEESCMRPSDEREVVQWSDRGQVLCRHVARGSGKFCIAILDGTVQDEALELALSCHVRLAVPETCLALRGIQEGRLPAWGGLSRLIQLLGKTDTLQRVLLGNSSWDAEEGRASGLLDVVAPIDSLEASAESMSSKVAAFDPDARVLLVRQFGIGERDSDTLDRFEKFWAGFEKSPYRPTLEYTKKSDAYLRMEDTFRNVNVLLDEDVERGLLKTLKGDQVDFLFQQLLDSLPFKLSGTVVDLGAGSCWLAAILSKMPEIKEVLALDLSDNEVALKAMAGLRTRDAKMDKIRFLVGNFNSVDLVPESVDAVFMARALHHSNDVHATLREVHTLLKPGGHVICFQEHVLPRVIGRHDRDGLATRTTVDLTVPQFRKVFDEVGFTLKAIPYFRNDYRTFLRIPYNRRYLTQYTPHRWLNGLFRAHFHLIGKKK